MIDDDDEILFVVVNKFDRRVVRVQKKMKQWRRIRDIIIIISHIIHHRANVANAKMKRLRNLLIQSKERAKTTKNRFRFFETENQQLLNILEIKRVKVETESDDEMMRNRVTTTTMKKKNEKKKKWKKFKNDENDDVMTTIENKFKTTFFLNRLMMTIAKRQRVERFFRKNR